MKRVSIRIISYYFFAALGSAMVMLVVVSPCESGESGREPTVAGIREHRFVLDGNPSWAFANENQCLTIQDYPEGSWETRLTISEEGALAINGNQVINSSGTWIGNTAGLRGDKGIKGEKGIRGDAIVTVADCRDALPSFCFNTCKAVGSQFEVAAQVASPCQVSSDAGSCSSNVEGSECCVCQIVNPEEDKEEGPTSEPLESPVAPLPGRDSDGLDGVLIRPLIIGGTPLWGLAIDEDSSLVIQSLDTQWESRVSVLDNGSLAVNSNMVIDSSGNWVGNMEGLQGDKGDKGDKGDPGNPLSTVVACGFDPGGCFNICRKREVASMRGPCAVHSNTGSCGMENIANSWCCICLPWSDQ